jgi:hypothetical protein
MRKQMGFLVGTMILVVAAAAVAAELKSGLAVGDSVGAFTVEKCAGNPEDGVPEGQELCYRCMLGNRPVVAVFARSVNGELTALVKELDALVEKHQDQKLASFVNLLGENPAELRDAAKKLTEKSKAKHIAVVVPKDHKSGPENMKISPDADVTVLIYRQGTVEANHALASGKLNKKSIAAIVADSSKILN